MLTASLVVNASVSLRPLIAGSTIWRMQVSAAASGLPAAAATGGANLAATLPGSSSYSDGVSTALSPTVTVSASLWVAALYASQHATSPVRVSAWEAYNAAT